MKNYALLGALLGEIEKWSGKYQFSFQFWGEDNNNVFINKDHVEITSMGGRESIQEILADTLEWIYRVNRIPNDKRIFNQNN